MRNQTVFKTYAWHGGKRVAESEWVGAAVGTQIEMADGRTVQVFLHSDGKLHVRAWGNIPITIGNMDQTGFRAVVHPEAPHYDELGNPLEVDDE